MTDISTILSIAEEAGNTPSVGDNRACSDGRSRKNKCDNGTFVAEGKVGTTQLLCYRSR